MKKYRYTIEFVTDSPVSERERNQLATALFNLITEGGAESGEEVYVNVDSDNPVELTEAESTQFKKDAGYDV